MILDETQEDRDKELSELTGVPVEVIRDLVIAAPESINIYDGNKPPRTHEEMMALYKEYENLNLVHYLRTLMFTSVHRRHPELMNLLRTTKGAVCLDFGSGVGTHAIALAQNGNSVSILDVKGPLLDFALERAARRKLRVWIYYSGDALFTAYYDVIICTDVLEHVFNPVGELIKITDALKPGGILHLQVSTMVKESSGHFKENIDKWLQEGPSYLTRHYIRGGKTIYVKR